MTVAPRPVLEAAFYHQPPVNRGAVRVNSSASLAAVLSQTAGVRLALRPWETMAENGVKIVYRMGDHLAAETPVKSVGEPSGARGAIAFLDDVSEGTLGRGVGGSTRIAVSPRAGSALRFMPAFQKEEMARGVGWSVPQSRHCAPGESPMGAG